jgi:hypothetical protein
MVRLNFGISIILFIYLIAQTPEVLFDEGWLVHNRTHSPLYLVHQNGDR